MKKRSIFLTLFLSIALGVSAVAGLIKSQSKVVKAAQEDEEIIETFEFEDFKTVEVDNLADLKTALGSGGNTYINLRKNIGTTADDTYINISGRVYLNLNGYSIKGATPSIFRLKQTAYVTIVNGKIAPANVFELVNQNIWNQYTISVYNANLILRDVEVAGTRSAVALYNSRLDVRDGCLIEDGYSRIANPQTDRFLYDAITLAGYSTVNLQGGSLTGKVGTHAYFEQNTHAGYAGDDMLDTSTINYSGCKIYDWIMPSITKNNNHIYGGKFGAQNFNASDSSVATLGEGCRFTKENINEYLRQKVLETFENKYVTTDAHKLKFVYNGNTYDNFVDALLGAATVKYFYQTNIASDSVTVTNVNDIPSGSLHKAGYIVSVDLVNQYITVVLDSKMNLDSSLSFRDSVNPQIEKTINPTDTVKVYTKYAKSSDNGYAKYNMYRGAQRQSYEWTITNTATGYSKTEKGYAMYGFKPGNVGSYEISCKISATNKYGLEQQVTTNKVNLLSIPYISTDVTISFVNTANAYTSAVYGELVPMKVSGPTDSTSGSRLTYQWYASYYSDLHDPFALPGATKSVYDYRVDYVGDRYLFVGVQAKKTSGSYDFYSEEVYSNSLLVHGKNHEALVVRKDTADKSVALGTEVLFQVSVIGDAEATDLSYRWYIEEGENHRPLNDVNEVNLTYSGTRTPNLTIKRNDAIGVYKYYCYVTDSRNNVTLTSKSEAFVLEYRNAGLPIIKTQPSSGIRVADTEPKFTIYGLDAQGPDYGGALSYKWYRSKNALEENDVTTPPDSLEYVYTENTNKIPTFDNRGSGIWYFYCEITNTVNGHKASINTKYVQILVYTHEPDVRIELTKGFEESEITIEVGEELSLSLEYDIVSTNRGKGYLGFSYGSIYCDSLASGMSITAPHQLVSTSEDELTNHYKLDLNVKFTAVGDYPLDADLYASCTCDPYDNASLRGSFGADGLSLMVHVTPKVNVPEILNAGKNTNALFAGNIDIGNFDFYRTGDIGAALYGTNVYRTDNTLLGALEDYDNFKRFELYVQNAKGDMVKAGESTDRENLPSFNFNTFNQAQDSDARYSNDFEGSFNAFIKVVYDAPSYFLDIPVSGGGIDYQKGLYVNDNCSFDSEVFTIALVSSCAHDTTRHEMCDHENNCVNVVCYGCGEIVETMALNLNHVDEIPATCHKDGVKAHDECPYCDKAFINGVEVSESELAIASTGHNLVHHAQKEATCFEKGNVDYYECSECHELFIKVDDNYVEATSDEIFTDAEHQPKSEWSHNSQGHYHVCEVCGQIVGEVEAHSDEDMNGICDVCGRDLNAQVELVKVTIVGGKFSDGTTEKEVEIGAVVSIVANSYDDKAFEGWYINNEKVSANETAQIVINEACTIEARFNEILPPTPPVDPDKPKRKGLPAGAVVGIIIGSVLILGIGAFAIIWFVVKKKSFADLKSIFKKKQ